MRLRPSRDRLTPISAWAWRQLLATGKRDNVRRFGRAPSLLSVLHRHGHILIVPPWSVRSRIAHLLRVLSPLRTAAGLSQPADRDDGTALGLQCILDHDSPASKFSCFGSDSMLTWLGGPGKDLVGPFSGDHSPRDLPSCPATLSAPMVGLARSLQSVAGILARRLPHGADPPGGVSDVTFRSRRADETTADRIRARSWKHEMLLNFFTSAGPTTLYPHSDLGALTLLLVPNAGGGKLCVEHSGRSRTIATSIPRQGRVPRRSGHGAVVVAFPGRRFREFFPRGPQLEGTVHLVRPCAEVGVGPRISIALFYGRHYVGDSS